MHDEEFEIPFCHQELGCLCLLVIFSCSICKYARNNTTFLLALCMKFEENIFLHFSMKKCVRITREVYYRHDG